MTENLNLEDAVFEQAAETWPPEQAAKFVQVADGWTRLHDALANAPKTIEPAPTVNIGPMAFRGGGMSGSLSFSDATPIMTCRCGVRCFGDSINDALIAWGSHVTTTHRDEI